MFATLLLALALAATGSAQAPEGYRTVYMTSMVDTQYVIAPVAAEAGNELVVCVPPCPATSNTRHQAL